MIHSIRRILSITFKNQVLTDDTLHKVMVEIEAIINFRPLVPGTFDPRDNEPLYVNLIVVVVVTPNHLLWFRGVVLLPPHVFDKKNCYARRHGLKSNTYQISCRI